MTSRCHLSTNPSIHNERGALHDSRAKQSQTSRLKKSTPDNDTFSNQLPWTNFGDLNRYTMASFGELVLVLGDLHIPSRASKIPAPFKRMLVPNKMQHVICTGNLSAENYEELRTLAPNLHVVAGEYDDGSSGLVFPETRVLQVGAFRIGVVHGHQIIPWQSQDAIGRMRRKLNVDILISGHTHKNEVNVQEGSFYHINPVRNFS